MSSIEADVEGCYATHLDLHPDAPIDIHLTFTVTATDVPQEGAASSVAITGATDPHRFLTECITPRVTDLKFTAPQDGEVALGWEFEIAP